MMNDIRKEKGTRRVPNSPTGQVLEARLDCSVLIDVDDWTRLTWGVRSGFDWSQTSLCNRSHESQNGTQANTRQEWMHIYSRILKPLAPMWINRPLVQVDIASWRG